MKKLFYIFFPLLTIILFLVTENPLTIENMVYIDDLDINSIPFFQINSPTDFNNLSILLQKLPGNLTSTGDAISWNKAPSVEIGYSCYGGDYSLHQSFQNYWEKDKEKIFFLNTALCFIIIPKVQTITVTLDSSYKEKFTLLRKDFDSLLGKPKYTYQENLVSWKLEVIKRIINSKRKLDTIYKKHPIIKTSYHTNMPL